MTRLISEQHNLEPDVVSLFGRFIGAGTTVTLELTVKGGSVQFAVGEVVTGGTSAATGTIREIQSLGGVWDVTTHTGTAVLVLESVTGTFQDSETLTGSVAGVAAADGTGTPGTWDEPVTGLKGKGVASVTASGQNGTVGLLVIALSDKWAALLDFRWAVIDATSPDDWQVTVKSETVASTKLITIQTFKGGVATALTADEKLLFEVVLSNGTSVPSGY